MPIFCIKPVCHCPRRGERSIGRDGLLPVVDGRKHFLALPATLRDLGHHLLMSSGSDLPESCSASSARFLTRAIHANVHLCHAANSTHVDPCSLQLLAPLATLYREASK